MSSSMGQYPFFSQTTYSLQGRMLRSTTWMVRVTAPRCSAACRNVDRRKFVLPFLRGLPCKPRISMARVRSLFDVAGRAGGGAGLLAGLLLFLVALDAQLVHDLLLGELSLGLELLDAAGLLREDRVADRAVHEFRLVA